MYRGKDLFKTNDRLKLEHFNKCAYILSVEISIIFIFSFQYGYNSLLNFLDYEKPEKWQDSQSSDISEGTKVIQNRILVMSNIIF